MQEPDLCWPLALHVDNLRACEIIIVRQGRANRVSHLDASGGTMALHSACRIHGIAPDVENEFRLTNDASRHRSGMHPDPDGDWAAVRCADAACLHQHLPGG